METMLDAALFVCALLTFGGVAANGGLIVWLVVRGMRNSGQAGSGAMARAEKRGVERAEVG